MHMLKNKSPHQQSRIFRNVPLFLVGVLIFFISCSQQESATSSVYNVEEFGAVGDSVTVNTEAIQTAIDRAYQDGGGTVVIPEGVFSSGSIYLKENVYLKVAE